MRRLEWLLIGVTGFLLVIICLGLVVTALLPGAPKQSPSQAPSVDIVEWGSTQYQLPMPLVVFPGVAPSPVTVWPDEEERWELEGWLRSVCWEGDQGWALVNRPGSITDVYALRKDEDPTKLTELAIPPTLASGAVCGGNLLVVADPRLDRTWLVSSDGQTWSTPADGVVPMAVEGGRVWGSRADQTVVTGPSEITVRGGEGVRVAMSRPATVRDLAVRGTRISWVEKGTDLQNRVVHGLPGSPAVHGFERPVDDVEILGTTTWIAGADGVFRHDGVWTRMSDQGTRLASDGVQLVWAESARGELIVQCVADDGRVLTMSVDPRGGDASNPARVAVAGEWILVPDMGGVEISDGDNAHRGARMAIRALANPCFPDP